MFMLVETLKSTYLCAGVTEEGTKTKLLGAFTVKDRNLDAEELAREWVRVGARGLQLFVAGARQRGEGGGSDKEN